MRTKVALCASALTAVAALVAPAASAGGGARPAGPDVASFQHPHGVGIDWGQVRRDGTSFAFVKATEGTTYTNPYFAQDYAAAHRAGLVRSAYHYARPRPGATSAQDQAKAFVHVAGTARSKGDLPLTLDLEETGGLSPSQLVNWTQSFISALRALTHRPTIIYSYPYFWQHAMGNSSAFTNLPLWIASYRNGGPKTPLPGGWKNWTFWQYTAAGSLSGIHGAVDESVFTGSQGDLAALADPSSPSGSTGPLPIPLPLPLPNPLPHLPLHPLPPTSHVNLPPGAA